ncbi:MAG: SWIM/SEC-C metal-binding protein [Colwellia sp.]|jgi:SWIM/SEC-C metal-binding protein|uniref:PBPRA1643 family SWIM/SEC-C metal-binding motif protein n=1 Tax=unclassified Colwellia TaxID=196834 RepID=UPI0015F65005|nr:MULTISPECIES: PBPRA1643 family SWIM/SEC-C metal-binding motif protein [unclassified Colwellia]MBA6364161.1 SEC-C domain-containing protein [Colwellia sp. BRX8-8]MBA6251466.1 SEC-C domain-containing protein [Colwellia sp. MB3u-55]MBA6352176.1 SEC-C domain-containing protein [Colwellia sp. BRX9-1]MBA6372583.1 SEC-C domain-containing protein [Colwellia sp. BRX8-4]MBA6379594.1 SEC-C domain-containing protein [Colwellia sp. BRX10-7]|tara:strand:+ start:527 stop:859 length:333 start_codon:yes stop_codon:yes gene_type:complete
MSKFFYRGTPDVMGTHGSAGYKPNRGVKLGSAAKPLMLVVASKERQQEVIAIVTEHNFIANIEINADVKENIVELEAALNVPKTQRFDKTPNRNDPCSCGSTKKYKKCCG